MTALPITTQRYSTFNGPTNFYRRGEQSSSETLRNARPAKKAARGPPRQGGAVSGPKGRPTHGDRIDGQQESMEWRTHLQFRAMDSDGGAAIWPLEASARAHCGWTAWLHP